jgi:hypothetical protein
MPNVLLAYTFSFIDFYEQKLLLLVSLSMKKILSLSIAWAKKVEVRQWQDLREIPVSVTSLSLPNLPHDKIDFNFFFPELTCLSIHDVYVSHHSYHHLKRVMGRFPADRLKVLKFYIGDPKFLSRISLFTQLERFDLAYVGRALGLSLKDVSTLPLQDISLRFPWGFEHQSLDVTPLRSCPLVRLELSGT